MKMRKLLLWSLSVLLLGGCALPLTDQRHFSPELEKRERDLMIRKDFANWEEKQRIEKDIDRVQKNYAISAPEDVLEIIPVPENKSESNSEKAIDDKIMRSLEQTESQRNKEE